MATRVDTTVKSRSNRANLDENYKNDNSPYSSISEAKNKIFRDNSIEEKHTGLTVLVKESGWTEAKEYWVQPLDTTPVTYGFVPKQTAEQVQADWNVSDSGSPAFIKNKPTIPSVPVISTDIASDAASDVKTASPKAVKNYVDSNKPSIQDSEQGSTAVTLDGTIHVSAVDAEPNENAGVEITPLTGGGVNMKFTLPKGDTGNDGSDGHNPCLGRFTAVPSTFAETPRAGDYYYVDTVDNTTTPPTVTETKIYKYDGTQWGSGTVVDVSNLTFNSGESVPGTSIDGTGLESPLPNALAKARDVVTAIGGVKEMQLNSEFVGKGQTYVSRVVYGLVPGRVYRVRLKSREWNKTGVTSGSSYKLFHIANTAGGVDTDMVIVATNAIPDNYYDITIPETSDYIKIGGRAAVGERVMFGIEDVTDEGVAYTKESDSTKVTIRRVKTSSSAASAEGTRIRIVMEVKAGMEVVASTTDPNGLSCGVWASKNVAFYATVNNCLQNISLAWTQVVERTEILTDGWLCISLTAGGAIITDEMKAEMLSKLSFVVGKGTLFDTICTSQSVAVIDRRVAELENVTGKPYVYYGEKVSLNGGYSFALYADNNQGGQSSACYGDYLFTVAENITRIACYNLKTKTLLYTLTDFTGSGVVVPSDGTWHCNQSSFSTKRYDDADVFPVLYVSQQNDGGDGTGRCTIVGLRIIPTLVNDEISTFTVSLVQTVKLPVMTDVNCLGNVNIAFDTELGYMWGYGRNNNSGAANYRKAMIVKFAIPELFDGNGDPVTLVELSDADILDSFPEEFSMYNAQGGFIKYGKLFILQGISQIYLRVIDLYLQKKQVSLVDMTASAGISFEMEGCWTYNGKVMTAGTGANLYEMEFA